MLNNLKQCYKYLQKNLLLGLAIIQIKHAPLACRKEKEYMKRKRVTSPSVHIGERSKEARKDRKRNQGKTGRDKEMKIAVF